MTSPLVSIITPTYNRAPLLRQTLASVRRQTYPNIEHIVVDGASTDDTLDVLRSLDGDDRMRWISEPDEGMYHAINKGLRMARGDILAYLNSDDLYYPWTVQTVVDTFAREPDASFVHGDALAIDDENGNSELYWTLPFNLDFIRRSGFLAQPTVFWRRKAFEDLGPFDERLRYVADCDYWMRAGASHRFVKVNEFLAVERNHGGTLREVAGDLWPELRAVRQRYVRTLGTRHERRERIQRLRFRLYHKWYLARLLVQSTLPSRIRGSAWRNMLGSGHFGLRRLKLLMRMTPLLGRYSKAPVLKPSRYWLEPENWAHEDVATPPR